MSLTLHQNSDNDFSPKSSLVLREQGESIRSIAKIVKCSSSMVFQALRPRKTIETRGRPSKLSEKDKRALVRKAKENPFMSSRDLTHETAVAVSSRTIRRVLLESKLPARSHRKVPLLKPGHMKKRLAFAKMFHMPYDPLKEVKQWRNVLWSDETKINLFGMDGKHFVRRPKGEAYNPRYTKPTVKHGGGSLMIWGCFSWWGIGPVFLIDGIMTKETYVGI